MDEQEIREFWKNIQIGDYLMIRHKIPFLHRFLDTFCIRSPKIKERKGYVVKMNVYGITLDWHNPGKRYPSKESRLAVGRAIDRPHICYVDILEYKKEASGLEAKVS